jgi:chitinase
MLRSRVLVPFAAAAAALLMTGPLAGAANARDTHGRKLPAHVFAPYFQAYNPGSPAEVGKASGAKYLTMAFLQTAVTGSCDILWNGDPSTPVAWSQYGRDIEQIRARGGDVIPSFGGYSADSTATEIADSCPDVDKIFAAYKKVVTTYGVTRLDMDIEVDSLDILPAIDRRNKAIAKLQAWARATGRIVDIVYTVPTASSGIEDNVKHLLQNAVDNGVEVKIVNIMTFDYYDDQLHQMADDTKTAAGALVDFLRVLYPHRSENRLWAMVGVTEMLGYDDYGSGGEPGPPEIFTLDDARAVTRWAIERNIGELSFWALGRDKATDGDDCRLGVPGGDSCSGIPQRPWQFTHIMAAFPHGGS